MQKLKLNLESLDVVTFHVHPESGARRGTVNGNGVNSEGYDSGCPACPRSGDIWSFCKTDPCGDTCAGDWSCAALCPSAQNTDCGACPTYTCGGSGGGGGGTGGTGGTNVTCNTGQWTWVCPTDY